MRLLAGLPYLVRSGLLALGLLSAAPRWVAAQEAVRTATEDGSEREPRSGRLDVLRLAWTREAGAEACLDAPQVEQAVRERLGRDPFVPNASASIEGNVRLVGAGYHARLLVRSGRRDAPTVRELSSSEPNCEALGRAVVLAVALVIDPERALRAHPKSGALEASAGRSEPAPEAPGTVSHAPRAAAPSSPSDGAARGALWAGGAAVQGLVPGWAFGVGLGGDLWAARNLDVRATALFLPEVRRPDGFGFGATVFGVDGCVGWLSTGPVRHRACGGLQAGAVHAVVYREDRTEPGERLWLAAALTLGSRVHFKDPLFGFIEGGAAVPFARYRFFVEGSDRTVHEQPLFVGQLSLGVGVTLR
jgi:hypothetical protein